ncbi:protein-L-isoaspartate(D-aspartate) O-methyltransferase [Neptunomonas marina]|uniref:Protein-L-isoaspartate O-methyltransferase n=1 Tax=Neptunomonas marina TaxID=1815562 RepID=A0A437Q6R9_9GAMM|nr:protein-L-isoaspartate(D-aspartate) O-methyltransferase [Neptunomonas marina]RVU30214.1 protein-L-isoaspartate(D-aspartate) O-methyltransferase [Neptunomonas marina]
MSDLTLQGIGMTSQRTRDRLVARLQQQGISNEAVLDVIGATPRHIFVDEALAHKAYEDTALPIGFNQTISQPYIVAKMTEELLASGPLEKVLEVGTGSGYQTAVLSLLVERVYSVERIKPLQQKASTRFKQLGLRNITLQHTDGGMGLTSHAPYDGIIVTAAPDAVPAELYAQLAIGGVMIIPVGGEQQELLRITRIDESRYDEVRIETVKFVPLLSGTIS